MGQWAYLLILAGCLCGAVWLEFGLRTRVLVRWRRLVLTIAPVALVFSLWDIYAIRAGHWTFDSNAVTGWVIGPDLPIDELLFFIVVPLCAVLTLEAVRSARGWHAGDEPKSPSAESL